MNKRLKIVLLSLLAAFGLAGLPASAQEPQPSRTASSAQVQVELGDFDQMRELRHLRGTARRSSERLVQELADWLAKQAEAVVPAGQHMVIELQDVDLAGEFPPTSNPSMQDVRVVSDLYPPQIDLVWRFETPDGELLSSGEERLRDPGFMSGSLADKDPLRHERRLLKRWLQRGFQ